MDNDAPAARAALVEDNQWESALEKALLQISDLSQIDLVLLFASSFYEEHFPEMLARVRAATHGALLIGCSGQGIIGPSMELEELPALSLLALKLPGAELR